MNVQLSKNRLLFHDELHLLLGVELSLLFFLCFSFSFLLHFDLEVSFQLVFRVTALEVHLDEDAGYQFFSNYFLFLKLAFALNFDVLNCLDLLVKVHLCLEIKIMTHY